jgi:O-antigen/teichoic acid export membrane protein
MAFGKVPRNIAANIGGQAAVVLLGLFCTPLYIKFLGIEVYGLLAFYLVAQAALQLFDLGFGATVNREVARLSASQPADGTLASFVVTFERWYWAFSAGVGLILLLTLPSLTSFWLRPEELAEAEVARSARIFALVAMFQWATSFYAMALMGLQRQVALNAIQVPFSVLATLGGVVFIWIGPRTITALLAWQATVMACQAVVVYHYFWSTIGCGRCDGRVRNQLLRDRWRFSAGMTGISTTGLLITHLDKWILSRLLSLEAFAHYSLAVTVSRALYLLITPVFNTYFPRLSALLIRREREPVRRCYHTASQIMAVLLLPMAFMLALFSKEIVQLWLHDADLAAAVAPLASILTIGTCLNGLMNIPFALQLAHGNTRIGLVINVCLLAFFLPSIAWATLQYGSGGGALMWAVGNALYLLVGIPVTHAYLLGGGVRTWLLRDLLPPAFASFAVVLLARWFVPTHESVGVVFLTLSAVWFTATSVAFISAARTRAGLLGQASVNERSA